MPAVPRVQILLSALLFGTTGTAQALGPQLEPLALGAARIVAGAALLGLVALVAGARRVGGGPRAVLLAGACVALYQATFFAAVADTGVAVGTVVAIGSAPAFAGLLARAFAGERLTGRWVAATALASAGVVLLVVGGGAAGSVSAPGVGLALLSGAGYAGYAVATKRMLDAGGAPEAVMASVFGAGALLLLPVFAIVPLGGLATAGGAALVLYLAVVPTALAYVLFARGLKRIGAGETATLTLAEPLTAAALGVVALGERPGLAAGAGAALVLGGLALLALRPDPPAAAPEPAHRHPHRPTPVEARA
ncbi:MAG: drug/metabolite transporter, family [Thermoleophilaceae bacterium]|jgi:DME family drug/metabolite transporter|nr:drug/metabolite transporter, family [Thermoleophilaceae bacterium]